MSKDGNNSVAAALDGLLSVGTVRGVCLARCGEVLVNRFPFSDVRLLSLCTEVEQVLNDFTDHGRSVERMVFGFDGGHLVLLVDGDVRLVIMHLIPDEADFVAKAGQALLADHRESIADMEVLSIERETAVETESELKEEEHTEEVAAAVETEVEVESELESEESSAPVAARNVQPPEQEPLHLVVSKPLMPELALESSLLEETERGVHSAGLRELLEASRKQQIDDSVLAASSEEEEAVVDQSDEASEEDRSLAAWAAEHLDLPEDASHLLPPEGSEKRTHHSPAGRTVVGAVRVQPVRLAAQQPQSTLPPPKKPRVRRPRESVSES